LKPGVRKQAVCPLS